MHQFSPLHDSFYVNEEVVGPLWCYEIIPGPTRREKTHMENAWKEFNLAGLLDHQKLTDYHSYKGVIVQGCVYKRKVRSVILGQLIKVTLLGQGC